MNIIFTDKPGQLNAYFPVNDRTFQLLPEIMVGFDVDGVALGEFITEVMVEHEQRVAARREYLGRE
jgi:hypothetical protein